MKTETVIKMHTILCCTPHSASPRVMDFVRFSNVVPSNWAIQELDKLGLHINFEKSCSNSKTESKFIGFLIQTAVDDDTVWLKIPKCRTAAVIKDIKRALKKGQVIAQALAI